MLRNFNFIKIFLWCLLIYTLFFILCGLSAPIFAFYKKYLLADVIYALMRRSCMQDAVRCFWILGYQMAICARCLGEYCGVIFAIVLYLKRINFNKMMFLTVMIIAFGEILLEYFKIYNSNNYIRCFAGFALGIFIMNSLYHLKKWVRKGEENV